MPSANGRAALQNAGLASSRRRLQRCAGGALAGFAADGEGGAATQATNMGTTRATRISALSGNARANPSQAVSPTISGTAITLPALAPLSARLIAMPRLA